MHDSAFARLLARVESLSVIEQAKGILMAQQRCGPEEAFDLLRQALQRTNVKLSVLAEQIVERVAFSNGDGARPTAAVDGQQLLAWPSTGQRGPVSRPPCLAAA